MEPSFSLQFTEEELKFAGLMDLQRAAQDLDSIAGGGITDELAQSLLPNLLQALQKSPDPDRSLQNFARWLNAVSNKFTYFQFLLTHLTALDLFISVCGVSQYFAEIMIRNPEYFEIIANPAIRETSKSGADFFRELQTYLAHIKRPELKLEALRRFRQREMLRIGARDILGLANMPDTAREFSLLADTCVQICIQLAVHKLADQYSDHIPLESQNIPQVPFIVVAMGKHGGMELNYSSDIDLMFVCGDYPLPGYSLPITPLEYAHKVAENVTKMLSDKMQNGHLFRVDMRLRPEGRFGPLVRTLGSYAAYYESWAEPWERQSLIKARPCAGDAQLAHEYSDLISNYVYGSAITPAFQKAIRENKERIEQKALAEKQSHSNVKVGIGGIRDIEFSAQILQLEYGRTDRSLRTQNTLEALARLCRAGYLSAAQTSELSLHYIFLRNVEHRLQIFKDVQTQSLPESPDEINLLAKRLGFQGKEEFEHYYSNVTSRVNLLFKTIFYGQDCVGIPKAHDMWREMALAIDTATVKQNLEAALSAEGFANPKNAVLQLHRSLVGNDYGAATPESVAELLSLLGELVGECSRTNDPDQAFELLLKFAESFPNPAALFRTLNSDKNMLRSLCSLAAGSLVEFGNLSRHVEWLDTLLAEENFERFDQDPSYLKTSLLARTRNAKSEREFWDRLALFYQRERLRIAARDIWQIIDVDEVGEELTALASAILEAFLDWVAHHISSNETLDKLAIIGLGKLGGSEPGYSSDWDVAFVYDSDDQADNKALHAELVRVAEFILKASGELRPRGANIEIDARLRPEGKKGDLVNSISAAKKYLIESAMTWEQQVQVKARCVAGNAIVGEKYEQQISEIIFAHEPDESVLEEIRSMKSRMERERLKSEERHKNVKLGNGGLSDIEFLVQLHQLKSGHAIPELRVSNTIAALRQMGRYGILPEPDAERLCKTYNHLRSVRNRLTLQGSSVSDNIPGDLNKLRSLAISSGFLDSGNERAEDLFLQTLQQQMQEARRSFERWFVH